MFFTCPNCGTVYDVPADKAVLAPKFSCAKCGHIWKPSYSVPEERVTFKQPPVKKAEKTIDPLPETEDPLDAAAHDFENPAFAINGPDPADDSPDLSVFNPIFKQPEEKPFYFHWLVPLYVAGIFFAFIAVYTLFFHDPRLPDMTIESLSTEFVENETKDELYLKAVLKNNTPDPLIVGAFKVTFIDGQGRVLIGQDIPISDLKIEAGETRPYTLFIGRPPSKTLRINAEVSQIIR